MPWRKACRQAAGRSELSVVLTPTPMGNHKPATRPQPPLTKPPLSIKQANEGEESPSDSSLPSKLPAQSPTPLAKPAVITQEKDPTGSSCYLLAMVKVS